MACGTRCVAFVVIYAIVAGLLLSACATSDAMGARQEGGASLPTEEQKEGIEERRRSSEANSIQPIKIPFKQGGVEWAKTGISLTASGEPKSGTTWLARVMVELCLQLCGNPENAWCEMGGLTVNRNVPAPWYDFEMLNADTGELYLHFKGHLKHNIDGLGGRGGCKRGGRPRTNTWGELYPCTETGDVTRDSLLACLPDTAPRCLPFLPTQNPSIRRMAVVFRDARNLMISEHRMRTTVYHHKDVGELEPFVLKRFKIVIAWLHQRWVWHTTFLKDVSHVVFYEDLQDDPHHLVDLAAFIGLDCTPEEADDVWQRHTYPNRPGDYTTYGLTHQTLEWMNTTMATLLPEPILERYGLTPIYT